MIQKNYVICDENKEYMERLSCIIQDKLGKEFSLYAFSDYTKVQLLAQKEEIDILLASEKQYSYLEKDESVSEQVRMLFIFCEKKEQEQGERIFKYQAADEIVKKIMQRYVDCAEMEDSHEESGKEVHLIGIYTPIGRCLQTTFAITLGQLLAKRHRTLYLNFESFSGLSRMLGKQAQYNMMDLLYFYDCAREKLIYRLEHMVEHMNGLDYVAPFHHFQELSSIGGEKWKELLEYLGEHGNYEYVILDLSEQMHGLLDILRDCEKIYTITKEDGFAIAKIQQYEAMLEMLEYGDVLAKTCEKRFPVFKQIPAHVEQYTYGEIADYTRMLLKEDWGYEN